MAYKQEIISELVNNRNETKMITEIFDEPIIDKNKINNNNVSLDSKKESLNLDLVEETESNYVFKFKLIKHQYPYYLLEYNKHILDNLNDELRTLFSAFITEIPTNQIYLIQASFIKDKISSENVVREYNNWSYHLNNFLNQHLSRCFTQYTIPTNEKNLFNYMRYKAIHYYGKSESISLIYKNDLNDFWIRIEGEAKSIEIEKKKIEQDINFFNQNSFDML
jgi:hypothetical protein